MGIEPMFLLYESSVLPLNYIGKLAKTIYLKIVHPNILFTKYSREPLDGIEPSTSSFVYTYIY